MGGAVKILRRANTLCTDDEAWQPPYESAYKDCTRQISKSDPQIFASMNDIEAYTQALIQT